MTDARKEEFDPVHWVWLIWGRRYWIALGTGISVAIGVTYALLATPVYHSETTIALKETSKPGNAAGILSQFGGVGGMVASQLAGGTSNLDKIEIILKGQSLAEGIVQKHDLLPLLFPKQWDAKARRWKERDPRKTPTLRNGAELLRTRHLEVNPEPRKGLMYIGIRFRDPAIAKRLVDYYLAELNEKIRSGVVRDAESNREYLERQLGRTFDPILQEKIRSMIAYEMERAMLISSTSFEVLSEPREPLFKSEPKRARLVAISLFIGLFLSIGAVASKEVFRTVKAALARRKP